jgi:hypothetical protein
MPADFDLVVIGGGPAGVFAALAAAEAAPGLRLLILERGAQPLAKVRISGGGRCNVTNACADPAQLVTFYPRGGAELRGPFTRFGPAETAAWFARRGVALKTEADGRQFPTTDRSQTIVDCLLEAVRQAGIALRTRCAVQALARQSEVFQVGCGEETITAGRVILAAGGGSADAYALAAGLGHTIIPPVPSLFTFTVRDARLEGLAGIAAEAALTLWAGAARGKPYTAAGPLLITHWGLSGPAVLRLSAWGARALAEAGYQARLGVNWLPPHTPESLLPALQAERAAHPARLVSVRSPALAGAARLPERLWPRLAAAAGIAAGQAWGGLSNQGLRALAGALTRTEFQIVGKGAFKEEFVTCGGVSLKEVDFRSLQSRRCPGLYFAGEVLDIDGLTGGFNFQAAWTTGWLAGTSAAA